ncbi:MAG TPA: hypothetical protein VLZ10_16615 [Thermodesulfobacteriota bacterium]|nr:hypothetical protein [Thermodesulfobacteriota bacterium]
MERGSFQGVATGLERIMENARLDLRETMDEFQGLCLMITPERNVPTDIITETRQTYKKIQDQLAKICGARQLLEGKYRQHYRRDYQRDREIMEITFLAKNLYLTFEYALQEIEAKRNRKDRGELSVEYPQRVLFPWFQSKENQIILLRNLRSLNQLDYKTKFELGFERRREVTQDGMRSVSLFVLSGEVILIDNLQSRMRLREYDITERCAEEEFRGALTHLREVPFSEVEKIIRRFINESEFLKMKCLLLRIRSQKDLEKEIIRSTENTLTVMTVGEVRVLSV